MMLKTLSLLFFFSLSFNLFAQEGHHFISNYQHEYENIDNHNADILQNENGVLYFANRKGILKFDGGRWDLIETPVSAYALALSSGGDSTFVGGKHKIGFISKNTQGKEVYTSLGDSLYAGQDFRVVKRIGDKVYFFSDEVLIEYNSTENRIVKEWGNSNFKNDLEISSFFIFGTDAFLELSEEGIYRISGEKLIPAHLALPDGEQILFSEYIPKMRKTLLGSIEGHLYWFNGRSIRRFDVEEQDFLEKSQIIDVVFLSKEVIAFATLRSGCILLNPLTGKTVEVLNYQTGLADNEIFAIEADKYNGIWLTHEYGFTRIDYKLPFKDFSSYQGIEGHILSVQHFKDNLYVSTSNGVFYLEQIKDYEEVSYIIQESIDVRESLKAHSKISINTNKTTKNAYNNSNNIITLPTTLNNNVEEVKKPLNKLERKQLRKLKRQQKKEEKRNKRNAEDKDTNTTNSQSDTEDEKITIEEENSNESVVIEDSDKIEEEDILVTENAKTEEKTNIKEENTKPKKKNVIKTLVRKKKNSFSDVKRFLALKSVKYIFKKIKGIEGKCKQIISTDEYLLVASNTGLYSIKDKKANKITASPINFIYNNSKNEDIYATTNDNALLVCSLENKKWKVKQEIGGFRDRVSRISEDEYSNLWLCGTDYIYQVFRDQGGAIDSTQDFSISNPYEDEILPFKMAGRLYFTLPTRAYYYDEHQKELLSDTDLMSLLGLDGDFLSQNETYLWIHRSDDSWQVFGDVAYNPINFTFLNILENVEKIIPSNDSEKVWVLTSSNNLYLFDTSKKVETKHKYALVLNHVKDKDGSFLPLEGLKLKYDNRNLSFHFTTPKFFNNKDVEYQYRLMGQMKEWTDWTKGGTFIFSSLNSGKHRLQVRSKDSFGHIEESSIYTFKILPPYWRSPYFYALEILIFGGLVFFTAIINRRSQHHNKLFMVIRQTLTMLTLIMCVEFIKVVLDSYVSISGSPVIDFGMEVAFALLIFPFERFFSKTVFKATIHTGGEDKKV